MVNYALPFLILLHFLLLSLIILGSGFSCFINSKNKVKTFMGYTITLFAVIIIFVIVFFPFPIDFRDIDYNIENNLGQTNNFIPLKSIFFYFRDALNGYLSTSFLQLGGNILLFCPYGFGLYIFFSGDRKKLFKVLLICLATSISIEIMQGIYSFLIGYIYRSMDVDDIILNTLGGVLGLFAAKMLYYFLFPKQSKS